MDVPMNGHQQHPEYPLTRCVVPASLKGAFPLGTPGGTQPRVLLTSGKLLYIVASDARELSSYLRTVVVSGFAEHADVALGASTSI